MFIGLAVAQMLASTTPANFKIDVYINGGNSDRICSIQRLDSGVGKAAKEPLPWADDLPLDLKVECRRATGRVSKIVRGVRGSMKVEMQVGYLIVWAVRDGGKARARLDFERASGEIQSATPGAQVPLLAGRWNLRVIDTVKRGFFDTTVTVDGGKTRELTINMNPGRIRVDLGGQKGQFEAFDVEGKSRGYAPAGQWLEIAPGQYRVEATLDEDLVNHRWPVGEFVVRPKADIKRRIRPRLATLRWDLKEPFVDLRVERRPDGVVVADGPAGDRWKLAPGAYRVAYRLGSGDVVGISGGEQVEEIELKAGKTTGVGKRPAFGKVITRLSRGEAPIYGMVELLSPANGEVIARFPVGEEIRVAPGSWPLRVVGSDGVIVPYERLLKVKAKGRQVINLRRQQSRYRLTMLRGGKRIGGTWLVQSQKTGEKSQAVSGEAMDLSPGTYALRAVCEDGRTSLQAELRVELGVDQEQESLCD